MKSESEITIFGPINDEEQWSTAIFFEISTRDLIHKREDIFAKITNSVSKITFFPMEGF